MNNTELFELFRSISKESNCFDREIALKKLKKQYKKSYFYKQTKYSLHKAYIIYCLGAFSNITTLLNSELVTQICHGDMQYLQAKFEEFLDGVDVSKIEDIINKFSSQVESLVLNNGGLQKELEGVIKSFQNSLR